MGSGKSLELIRVAYNYIEREQKILLLSSSLDDRFGKNIIASRTGIKMPCISINNNSDILSIFIEENLKNKIDCVIVDESQFLTIKQIDDLSEIVDNYYTPVMCYGLRSDYKIQAFEGSLHLMLIADEIQEIKCICHCGKKSIFNVKITDSKIETTGTQIEIGDTNYISLCRKCFKEKKISKS
jgi:thymidine kinase